MSELGSWDDKHRRKQCFWGGQTGVCPPLSVPESWRPCPPPKEEAHLLWRCPRRSARWCPLRSAPSATGREGTGLTCARRRRSGPCTRARGGDEGPCIPRGCRSGGGRTGPKHKAEPLCQGQLLLPDYPEKITKVERIRENTVSVAEQNVFPGPGISYPDALEVPALCPKPSASSSSSPDPTKKEQPSFRESHCTDAEIKAQ